MNKKTEKINSVAQRYSACEEAVALVDILLGANRLLLKKARRVYPSSHQDEELIASVKTIEYDLRAIKDEIQDLAMELAEEGKDIKEGKDAQD